MSYPDPLTAKAIFLDKDGTLVKDVPYNVDADQVVFETGVFEGLEIMQSAGYKLVVISNQSGLALQKFSQSDMDKLVGFFYSVFQQNNLQLWGFYYCPHAPASDGIGCTCRKPEPGLLLQAAGELGIDLNKSWMIGDILNDVEAGNRAGCRTVLIDNGNETEWVKGPFREPGYTTSGLLDAARFITTTTSATNV